MLTRKTFLRRLAALPLVALLAPAALQLEQEGQPQAYSTATYIGQTATTAEPLQGLAHDAAGELTATSSLVPTIERYAEDNAGDWTTVISAPDRSWITFVDKFGRAVNLVRDSAGELQHVGSTGKPVP